MKSFFKNANSSPPAVPQTQRRRVVDKTAERKFFFVLTVAMLLAGIIFKISGI